jgi:hypothetical protein
MKMDTHFDSSPLFVSKPAYQPMEKVAAITLGRDANNWEQEISQALHKEHPFIHEHNINIFMTKSDPESGTAIGSLQLDSKILIPIIIDKFKLAPLDMFYHENKLHPLTRSSLETVLQDTTLGKAEAFQDKVRCPTSRSTAARSPRSTASTRTRRRLPT